MQSAENIYSLHILIQGILRKLPFKCNFLKGDQIRSPAPKLLIKIILTCLNFFLCRAFKKLTVSDKLSPISIKLHLSYIPACEK
jgi:hypothetical protein